MQLPLPQLGLDREPVRVVGLHELRTLSVALVEQSRRSLEIVSRDLDPRVYDQQAFLDAVRTLATRSRYSRIRVLIRDVDAAVKADHRLIEIARRLSSFIEIRQLGEDDAGYNEALLLADGTGFLRRPLADRFETEGSFNDPPRARDLLRLFDGLWSRSVADSGLRRLYV